MFHITVVVKFCSKRVLKAAANSPPASTKSEKKKKKREFSQRILLRTHVIDIVNSGALSKWQINGTAIALRIETKVQICIGDVLHQLIRMTLIIFIAFIL